MKGKLYWIYVILVLAACFLSNYYLGGLSARTLSISGLILMAIPFVASTKFDAIIKLYIAYLLVLVVMSNVNGYVNDENFMRQLLAGHLPGLLFYIATPCYMNTPNKQKSFIVLFTAIWLFDIAISIGQYIGIDAAWSVGSFLNTKGAENLERFESSIGAVGGSLLGQSIIFGLFGSVVVNGYYITMFAPLAIRRFFQTSVIQDKKLLFVSFAYAILAITASFMLQQRMSFILLVPFVVYALYKHSNIGFKMFLVFVLMLFVLMFSSLDWDFGRLLDFSDESREDMYSRSVDVILNTKIWLVGGLNEYLQYFEHVPHNTFLGAWVYTGIIGLIVFSILLYKVTIVSLRTIKNGNYEQKSLAFCLLMFLLYSMTHSTGLHNGSAFFWLTYALMKYYNGTALEEQS